MKTAKSKASASLTDVKNKTGNVFAAADKHGYVTISSYNKDKYVIATISTYREWMAQIEGPAANEDKLPPKLPAEPVKFTTTVQETVDSEQMEPANQPAKVDNEIKPQETNELDNLQTSQLPTQPVTETKPVNQELEQPSDQQDPGTPNPEPGNKPTIKPSNYPTNELSTTPPLSQKDHEPIKPPNTSEPSDYPTNQLSSSFTIIAKDEDFTHLKVEEPVKKEEPKRSFLDRILPQKNGWERGNNRELNWSKKAKELLS